MAKDLIVHAHIKIEFFKQGKAKQIAAEHVKKFWDTVSAKKIAAKQGCYIFALRAAKGYTPWYVGRTYKSFGKEAFAIDKLNKYNAVPFDGRKGLPVMFFVAPAGNKNNVPNATCDAIETFLIPAAYDKNPKIKNRQKTRIPDWTIKGIVPPGHASKLAGDFKKMMGLK